MVNNNKVNTLANVIKGLVQDKESTNNKTSSWNSQTNNTRYPTEKLVKDSLDNKANSNHTHLSSDVTDLIDIIYPVGSIYMSVNTVNPSTLFGGTWEQIKDTFLLSSGDTYNNGTTGGSATVTLTENQMPSHTHTQNSHHHGNNTSGWKWISVKGDNWSYTTKRQMSSTSGSYYYPYSTTNTDGLAESERTGDTTATNQNKGGGQAHNNMPPYIVVNVWKRTA